MSKIEKISSFAYVAIVLLISTFALWRDCSLLFQTFAATGIDGYYYVLQINTLRNEGHLYFSTYTPFVLYLLTAVSYLLSDTILAIKLSAIVLHFLLGLGVLALITIVTQNRWLGLCGFLIASFSGLHFYFVSEFLSNLGALMFIVWAAWGALKFVQTRKYVWLVFSALLLLASIFSHRSMLGLIIINVFTILLAYIVTSDKFSSRLKFLTLIATGILFILPLILAWQPFFDLPHQLEFELLKIPMLPFRQINLAESIIMALTFFITIFLWLYRHQTMLENIPALTLVSILLWSLLITLNPFLNHHTGFIGLTGRL